MMSVLAAVLLSLVLTCSGSVEVIRLEGYGWQVTNSNGSIMLSNATVPGNMYTAMMSAGLIPDPYYRFNDDELRWVHWDNWTYTTNFQASSELVARSGVRLVCEGLDTVSTVYVNNQVVGTSVNQFVRYVYDITSAVQVGTNEIRIAFKSAPGYAKNAFDIHPYVIPPDCPPPYYHPECHANMIRKAQCSFSWDWGPSFATQGVWRDIWVESFDVVSIRDVVPHVTLESGGTDWLLNVTVHMDIPSSFEGRVQIHLPEIEVLVTHPGVSVPLGGAFTSAGISIPQTLARPWWPRGYGDQPLYDLTVTLLDDTGVVTMDTKTVRMGFRTVENIEDSVSTGLTWYFKVNDVPIYMKGSNWIPVDSFYDRVTEERHRHLLESAVAVNMNSIRIWGGGVYELDQFYDICDELGILIWQDLMFACSMYPVDKPFLQTVDDEVRYQVRRLSSHPSVMAWSGNNENEGALVDNWYDTAGPLYPQYKADYIQLYIDIIRTAILQEDLSRPFFSSSPSNGLVTEQNNWISENPKPSSPDYGDIHYYNYLSDCLDHTIYLPTRYASEYGLQSWPAYSTLSKVSTPGDLVYNSSFTIHREHHPGAGSGTEQMMNRHFNWPNTGNDDTDFRYYIYLSQATQAMCYKVQTEAYRRARSDPLIQNMGALYWQHIDIWQAPTWATIDFDSKWKMAHYYAAHFFADPMVSSIESDGWLQVYSVTDALTSIDDAELVINLWSWNSTLGSPLFTWVIYDVHVPGAMSSLQYNRSVSDMLTEGQCPDREQCVLTLYLQDWTRISPVNPHYLTSWKDAVGMMPPSIQVTEVTEVGSRQFQVTLSASKLAAFVWLEALDIGGWFSENGFLWAESPTVTLTFNSWDDVTSGELQNAITVMSLVDVYQ